jgi:DASH complex subunit SPC19
LASTLQHYELLPEPHLHDAQAALRSEITPSITHLLQLAGNHVEKLKRGEESLRAKSELQEGRIEWGRSSSGAGAVAKGRSSGQGGRGTSVLGEGKGADKAAELQRLRQKKERLKYAVERLELQSKQRQRELRRSVGSKVGSDAWGVD